MLKDIALSPYRQSDEGILTHYDVERDKWLSIERQLLWFGVDRKNVRGKRWLHIEGGVPSNVTGYQIIRNGTITNVSIKTKNESDAGFAFLVKRENQFLTVFEVKMVGGSEYLGTHLNINLNAGDLLEGYIYSNEPVHYPNAMLEFAWRF